jgi:very-short-patch-repair endonuclease
MKVVGEISVEFVVKSSKESLRRRLKPLHRRKESLDRHQTVHLSRCRLDLFKFIQKNVSFKIVSFICLIATFGSSFTIISSISIFVLACS